LKPYKYLLVLCYPIIRVLNDLVSFIIKNKKNKLRVLILHDIPNEDIEQFSILIEWLQKRWKFVTPETFELMINGSMPIIGRNLLLTFDDGFISNYNVAKTVLHRLNIKAIFFVITDFVNLNNTNEINNFIFNNIQLGTNESIITDEKFSMKWEHLKDLLNEGHAIGAHTKSHKSLGKMISLEETKMEVIDSADLIQQKLQYNIKHFAFPFGNINSINLNSYLIAISRFDYIYSGFRGNNLNNRCQSIMRDAITTKESKYLIGSYLEGSVDFLYKKSFLQLDYWLNHNAL
jgi:peptidoglycan/xylan/chitin deacetylase (PgdA/CDA1 family)